MTTYSSQPVLLTQPVSDVYSRISDLSSFQTKVDSLPDEIKAKIGSVRFDADSITINAAPMGDMTLAVTERIDNKRVALQANNSPVPLILSINLAPQGDSETMLTTAIEVEIPAMLKPMVGPKLQEAANRFGEMIQNLSKA